MASVGPLSPSQSSTTGFTTAGSWSNASNIGASDNSYATIVLSGSTSGSGSDSEELNGRDFGANVPAGATIDGVLVEIEAKVDSAGSTSPDLDYVTLRDGTTPIGTAKTSVSDLTTSDVYYSRGGSSDTWGASLTAALVNSANFGVRISFGRPFAVTRTVSVDHIRVTIYYTVTNTAPDITAGPTVSYGSLTRTGPNNTPAVVSFTATDAEETGAGELDYEIRTASGGGGTLVASGTCTSGNNQNVNIAHNASGINEGSNTLYLVVSDGTDDDEESFTLLVDRTAPSVGAVTTTPTTVRP